MWNPRFIRFFMALSLMNGALLTIGIWTGAFSLMLHLFTIPLAVCIIYIVDKLGNMIGSGLSGWIPGQSDPRERFTGDLEKIKYSKRMGQFDEALHLVNELLHQDKHFPEALFLKAQILWEGFGNAESAKAYLEQVRELIPEDEALHRWASGYFGEMDKQKEMTKLKINDSV